MGQDPNRHRLGSMGGWDPSGRHRLGAGRLRGLEVEIVMPLVGRYATSMEMTGLSLTFCRLDEEMEQLLQAPCDCPFWRV